MNFDNICGLCRRIILQGNITKNVENVFGKVFSLLYASILFTALHVGWKSGLDLAFVFGVALSYGYSFQKTRSLLGVTLSNTFLFLIMPFIFPVVLPYLMTIF